MPRPQPHRAATRCAIFCVSQARETRNASPASQMEPFARAARSQERTAAQPRGLDRTPPERKLAAKSPPQPPLHTPLSLPLERERLHARGGARKAKGHAALLPFFAPCPDWLDGGSRLACRKVSSWTSSEMLVLGLGFSSSPNLSLIHI